MAVRRKCSGTLSVQNQEWSQLIPGTERRKSAKIGQVSASCSCFIKKKGQLPTWDDPEDVCKDMRPAESLESPKERQAFVGYFPHMLNYLGTRSSGYDAVRRSNASNVSSRSILEWERALRSG